MSGRREELQKEIELTQKRIDEAPKDTPERLLQAWHKELDSLSFELDNLYDDEEND